MLGEPTISSTSVHPESMHLRKKKKNQAWGLRKPSRYLIYNTKSYLTEQVLRVIDHLEETRVLLTGSVVSF